MKKESIARKTIRLSTTEGIFAQFFFALASPGSIFITKFAILLGALPIHFGIISAIGQISLIFQPIGYLIMQKVDSMKREVIKYSFINRVIPLLFCILPFIMPLRYALYTFIVLFFLSASFKAISDNIWIAWVSDIIPLRFRGRFFGARTRFIVVAGLGISILASFFIDYIEKTQGNAFLISGENFRIKMFAVIFAAAFIAGMISIFFLLKQPELKKRKNFNETALHLFSPFKDKNFRMLVLYAFWWMGAVGIGAPFWQPFMIKNLSMSMTEIQIYGVLSTAASVMALKPWGKFIDTFGNKTAMRFAIILSGMNPLIWIFLKPDNYWFVYIEAATSGIMWSGANIIALNFVLSIAPENQRQLYSGVYGAVTGIAMMLTMLLSGFFLPRPMEVLGLSMTSEQVLFAMTGLARWTAQIPLSWIDEPHSKTFAQAVLFIRGYAKVRMPDPFYYITGRKRS